MCTVPDAPDQASLQAEIAGLRARLDEAEETLRAIREGEADAIIVSGSRGDRVFSLTETENLHRLMVETMNEAGLAISPEGLLLYCNERAAALLQQPRSALLGRPLMQVMTPQDARRLQALLDASRRGTADDRVVFRAADGTAVPLHLWASRIDRPGEPMICLVGTDLTRLEADSALVAQLVEQQHALRASRAQALASMAQAVTAREQAAVAVEELRESDRRKDIFLATLAHELRNPLAPLRHGLEILRLRDAGDVHIRAAQSMMGRQLAHLVRMVDDLMEVSRITRGKLELRKERVELAAIVESAVETVRPAILAAHQRLAIELPSAPLWLAADPVRLTQVLGNLLNNASKYTGPEGDIRVAVRLDGVEVRISVQDTGVGIPADLLPRVFDLFQQGDSEQRAAQGGLGIGLSLVKGLVALHDGRVEAHSAGPGCGSEILVYLPAPPAAAPPSPVAADSRDPADPAGGLRVLIVDDNRDAADSLAMLLGLRGAAVRVAYDGPSALAALDECRPGLAILDIGMPGMDGHELARRIRARTANAVLTLVAMTGRGQASDRQCSLDAGFDLHLVKPVSLAALEGMLAGVTARSHSSR